MKINTVEVSSSDWVMQVHNVFNTYESLCQNNHKYKNSNPLYVMNTLICVTLIQEMVLKMYEQDFDVLFLFLWL